VTEQSPANLAAAIVQARQRLVEFLETCTEADWHSAPVHGDPRPAGVIVDHVADAYEYLAGFIQDVAAGTAVTVSEQLIDDLNAAHAQRASGVTTAQAAAHLRQAGDAIITLVAGLTPEQLAAGGGRARRFAEIAARHADSHREELQAALAARGHPATDG
jgi:DinB superfamily